MGKIAKALIYEGAVSVAAVSATDIVNEAITLHSLSPVCAAAVGRTLIATAYLGSRLKNELGSITVNIKGDGPIGGIVAACDAELNVRGYAENPDVHLPLKRPGKLDVAAAVGRGRMSVVADFGRGEPFVAQSELISGEIAEDFAHYFAVSEQQPSVVALGVLIGKDGSCEGAGGVIIHPLPGCPENVIDKVEALGAELSGVSALFAKYSASQVLEVLFAKAGLSEITERTAEFKCKCGDDRIQALLLTVPEEELLETAAERGSVEVVCHFCSKRYEFGAEEIRGIFVRGRKNVRKE